MRKKGVLSLLEAYNTGINKFYEFIEWCIDLGVKEVTLYALSLENMKNRSLGEISTLVSLFSDHALKSLEDDRIHKNKVCINFCGDRARLFDLGGSIGEKTIKNIEKLENSTRGYENLNLNIALAYGGRQEILNAVEEIVRSGYDLTEENLRKNLWIKSYPEIIIRTAESRLSNFLLWQSAYSEIYFIEKLWQEIEKEDLVNVLDDFNGRERRFGR